MNSDRHQPSERGKNIASAKEIKRQMIDQILCVGTTSDQCYELLDEVTPETRDDIFNSYVAPFLTGVVEIDNLISLTEIASQIIPNSFLKNETIAKEVISGVARAMYAEYLSNLLENQPVLRTLFYEGEDEAGWINRQVKEFHKKRVKLASRKAQEKLVAEDPDYYAKLREQGNLARGARTWSDEEKAKLAQLAQTVKWGEGSRAPGKTNWKEIARIFREMTGDVITPKQARDVYLTMNKEA